jgi:hypothetical protein
LHTWGTDPPVYFPVDSFISFVTVLGDAAQLEVGIAGS